MTRRQGSRSLELRAAVGLASAWQQSGREAEARSLLSPLSDEFTEGLDTADLRQVATLLTTLD